jgi:hypothetical protein
MSKIVLALDWGEVVEECSHSSPCRFDAALVCFAKEGLELGEAEEDRQSFPPGLLKKWNWFSVVARWRICF